MLHFGDRQAEKERAQRRERQEIRAQEAKEIKALKAIDDEARKQRKEDEEKQAEDEDDDTMNGLPSDILDAVLTHQRFVAVVTDIATAIKRAD